MTAELPMTTISFRVPWEDKFRFLNLTKGDAPAALRGMVHTYAMLAPLTPEQAAKVAEMQRKHGAEEHPSRDENQREFDFMMEENTI